MKKLEKLTFKELQQSNLVINKEMLLKLIAGGDPFKLKDGSTFTNHNENGEKYCTYEKDGLTIRLDGVNVSGTSWFQPDNTGYQLNGEIHVDPNSFEFSDVMHEYGHYLQQEELGFGKYMSDVAIPSAVDLATRSEENMSGHSEEPYEKDADKRADEFLKNWYEKTSKSDQDAFNKLHGKDYKF